MATWVRGKLEMVGPMVIAGIEQTELVTINREPVESGDTWVQHVRIGRGHALARPFDLPLLAARRGNSVLHAVWIRDERRPIRFRLARRLLDTRPRRCLRYPQRRGENDRSGRWPWPWSAPLTRPAPRRSSTRPPAHGAQQGGAGVDRVPRRGQSSSPATRGSRPRQSAHRVRRGVHPRATLTSARLPRAARYRGAACVHRGQARRASGGRLESREARPGASANPATACPAAGALSRAANKLPAP